jgi:hypothetical protein
VPASFSCREGTGGPGLASCNDSVEAETVSGGTGRLDTLALGAHTYTVTATSKDGQTGTAQISYTVISQPIKCVVPRLKGKTLRAAKKALSRAHCALGKVRRAYSSKVRKGRVISQRPGPGVKNPWARRWL